LRGLAFAEGPFDEAIFVASVTAPLWQWRKVSLCGDL